MDRKTVIKLGLFFCECVCETLARDVDITIEIEVVKLCNSTATNIHNYLVMSCIYSTCWYFIMKILVWIWKVESFCWPELDLLTTQSTDLSRVIRLLVSGNITTDLDLEITHFFDSHDNSGRIDQNCLCCWIIDMYHCMQLAISCENLRVDKCDHNLIPLPAQQLFFYDRFECVLHLFFQFWAHTIALLANMDCEVCSIV